MTTYVIPAKAGIWIPAGACTPRKRGTGMTRDPGFRRDDCLRGNDKRGDDRRSLDEI